MHSTFTLKNPTTISVEVNATYFIVDANKLGYICNGKYDILPVLNKLRVPLFNGHGVYQGAIRYYRYHRGRFHIPRNTLWILEKHFEKIKVEDPQFNYRIVYNLPNPATTINLQMRPEWKDRVEHEAALAHLLNTSSPMRGNDLQTGKGKTYVGIKTSTILRHPTAIICESLVDQWVENYIEKTNIPSERIYVIQGVDSIISLWKILNDPTQKDKEPWVLIGSLKTMSMYAQHEDLPYSELPPLNELFVRIGIGEVIHDEIHLSTNMHVLIDMVINIEHNLYLSATPKRSDKHEQAIFTRIYPKGMIGGTNKYDKYVNTKIILYDLHTKCKEKKFINFGHGYSHIKYESVLLNDPSLRPRFLELIIRNLYAEYHNRVVAGDKCLVIVSTVRMAEWIKSELVKRFDAYDIRTYLSSDPIDNLHDADIIISTPKSCGVGKDIRGLITLINTVSMSSEPGLEQLFGRLRKLPEKECRFIDLINQTVESQLRHFTTKKATYKSRSVEFEVLKE